MAEGAPRRIATARPGASAAILAAAVEVFALTTTLPWVASIAIGAAGIAAAILLRTISEGRRTNTAAGIVLLVLGLLATAAPDSRLAGTAGGLAVLALLLWLADEPGRVAGGMRRALPAVGVAGLGFAVAWVSAFLLPVARVPTGVIAALLVAVLLLATVLFARPELLELEPPLTTG